MTSNYKWHDRAIFLPTTVRLCDGHIASSEFEMTLIEQRSHIKFILEITLREVSNVSESLLKERNKENGSV